MAFTSDGQENLTFSVPITKATEAEDGTVYVEGLCTDDGLDLDQQVIEKDFAVKGLTAWFSDWANVRAMHSSNLPPAGKAVDMEVRPEGVWIKTHVVEPTAIKLVKEGVYQAYSVGIAKPRIIRDPNGIAKNGLVVDGIFSEVSLVDFPANPRARFSLAKRAKSGEIEIVEKAVEVELTKAAPTPAEVFGPGGPVGFEPEIEKRDISEDERKEIPAEDFAGPDKTYPIVKPADVAAAAHLVGKADDPEAVKAKIIAIAKRKGADFVAELPESWTKEEKSADAGTEAVAPEVTKGARDCAGCGKSHDADSSASYCADCGKKLPDAPVKKSADAEVVAPEGEATAEEPKVEKSETPAEAPDAEKAADADLAKGYEPKPYHADPDETVKCPKCGKMNDTDAVYCDQCGYKLEGSSDVSVTKGLADTPAEPEAAPAESEPAAVEKGADPDLVKSVGDIRAELVKFAPATELDALRDELAAEREAREALEKRFADLESSPDPRLGAYRGGPLAALRPKAEKSTAGRADAEDPEVLKSIILKARKDITGPAAEQLKHDLGPTKAARLIFGEGE